MGYGLSFVLAVVVYIPFSKMISDYCDRTRGNLHKAWTVIQWCTTGVLWSVWLQQDMSNIAVFLPRSLNVPEIIAVSLLIFGGLGLMLWQGGEKIQVVVEEKSRVKDVPEATVVDAIFAVVTAFAAIVPVVTALALNVFVAMTSRAMPVGVFASKVIVVPLNE